MTLALMDGRSLVIAGRLGSGKSYLLRDVVQRLRAAEQDPLVLHTPGRLTAPHFDALEVSVDPRSAALRSGREHLPGSRVIVVVDDVHALDPASTAALARAVYAGRAVVLLSLAVDPDGADPDAGRLAVDLWLRGLADRVDLEELRSPDAEALLDQFAAGVLDSVTRAVVITLAAGSRLLLRELAGEAVAALRGGRDPIEAFRDCSRHGRLGEALTAHVRQLSDADRVALAALGRTPGIHRADATRVVSSEMLDSLIGRGLISDDDTGHRRITANPALARIAEHEVGAARVDALLAPVAARMLTSGGAWWSVPIATIIAAAWHGGTPIIRSWEDVPDDLRARVCLDAAQRANDLGDLGLAAAYARMGITCVDSADLRRELAFAQIARSDGSDPTPFLERFALDELDGPGIVRCVDLCLRLGTPTDAIDAERVMAYAESVGLGDHPESTTFDLARAQTAMLGLLWGTALENCERAYGRPGAALGHRIIAASLAGLSATNLGSWPEAERWFSQAARLASDRTGGGTTSRLRLTAVFLELIARAQSGTDASDVLDRMAAERVAAAREGDPTTIAAAGLATTVAHALGSEPSAAIREHTAASRRAHLKGLQLWQTSADLAVARSLALLGGGPRARSIIDSVDPAQFTDSALVQHERWMTVSSVLLSEGRLDGAETALHVALGHASNGQNPSTVVRDLYQLASLSARGDGLLARVTAVAETTDLPAIRGIATRVSDLAGSPAIEDGRAIEHARAASTWYVPSGSRPSHGRGHSPRLAPFDAPQTEELTRREREIALLVHEGLTNREIADQLYLSVRTVESHVYQARGKVDARSRGELGRIISSATWSSTGSTRI